MKITFPNKTAQEIVEEFGNKLGDGKLLYNTDWYKKEDFYTKEKCREMTVEVSEDLIGLGSDWNECQKLAEKEGGEMLNFAETVWFLVEYYKKYEKYPDEFKWSWTSSRSSRGNIVDAGSAGADGLRVDRGRPGYSDSRLGLRTIRSMKS